MENKFTVATVAVVFNQDGKVLVIKRSEQEEHVPGIYAYPGGKVEYDNPKLDVLESNLSKEILEETNITIKDISYLSSHSFAKDNGDKVIVVAYIAQYQSGEAKVLDTSEVSEVSWIEIGQIDSLNMLPIVKNIYHHAAETMEAKNKLVYIQTSALVINQDKEFLLVKYTKSPDQFTFPHVLVKNITGNTWEIMEKTLQQYLHEQLNIDISENPIPFTDQSFLGKHIYDKINQFYITRYAGNDFKINDPTIFSDLKWLKLEDISQDEVNEMDLHIFTKAQQFITQLES